jgi:hypothetical protein
MPSWKLEFSYYRKKTEHVSQFSITVTSTWDKQFIGREGLFWFTVLEVSVHGQLTCCFLACREAAHHDRGTWQKKLHTLWGLGSKERERGGVGVPMSPSRVCPWGPNLRPQVPTSWSFHNFPIVPQAGDHTFNTWAFGGHSRAKL